MGIITTLSEFLLRGAEIGFGTPTAQEVQAIGRGIPARKLQIHPVLMQKLSQPLEMSVQDDGEPWDAKDSCLLCQVIKIECSDTLSSHCRSPVSTDD